MKNKKAYALGVMSKDFGAKSHERLWCLFSSFNAAEKSLFKYASHYFEDCYHYAIIEEVCFADVVDEYSINIDRWYSCRRNSDGKVSSVRKINKPKRFKNIVNFWVG